MNKPLITLDIDWAPDCVVDEVAELLLAAEVRATWFVTYASPAIERLKLCPDLFELGIHPNFLPNSTHGHSPEEVIDHICDVAPVPTSVRTHALFQSTPLMALMFKRVPSLRADVSLFLPHAKMCEPVRFDFHGASGIRFPYIWEDDLEMYRPRPVWRFDDLEHRSGLRIFDFHPIHIVLNDPTMESYSRLKELTPELTKARCEDIEELRKFRVGPRTMFEDMLALLRTNGGGTRIADLVGSPTEREGRGRL